MTPQMDFSGTGTMTKRKMKYLRKRRNRGRRQMRRMRFKLKRLLPKPRFFWNPAFTYSASWVSGINKQACALIPFVSYRGGVPVQTPPTASNMTVSSYDELVPSCDYCGPQDIIENYVDGVITKQFIPTGASSNAQQSTWWAKIKKVYLDMTLTNTGFATDTYFTSIEPDTTVSTVRNVEYELYFYWPGPDINKDPSVATCLLSEISNKAGSYQQKYGASTEASSFDIVDPNWDPKHQVNLNRMFKTRKIGQGYLEVGKSVRIVKSFKPKYLLTKQKYDADSVAALETELGHKRGLTAGVLVVWRGTKSPDPTEHAYDDNNLYLYPSRLSFTVSNHFYFVLDGNLQRGAQNNFSSLAV